MTRNGEDYGPLLLRASLGLMLISHGFLKIFAIGIPFTMRFFESQGYAGYLVYPVLLAEMGGGLLLVLGVHTRWIALLLMPTLIGAAKVHLGNGYPFSSLHGGWEFPVYLILTDAVLIFTGGGAWALLDSGWSLRPRRAIQA
jgi:putative oxidoreductase